MNLNNRIPLKIDDLPIIGSICSQARLGYGGNLIIGLGELVHYENKKIINLEHGIIEIRSDSCSWRVSAEGRMIAGYYDDEKRIEEAITILVGSNLLEIDIKESISDTLFLFSNGIEVRFFEISAKAISWEIYGPRSFIEICPGGNLNFKPMTATDELSDIERIISKHTKECHDRWQGLVPEKSKLGICNGCVYYSPLKGIFYFWDYGLCTNKESPYDGKLTNVKSGCLQYSSDWKEEYD